MDNSAPLEARDVMQESSHFRLLLRALIAMLIIAAVGAYGWYSRYTRCDVNAVKEASAFLITQLKTYDSQYQFTTTVYRSGLNPPVNKLQQIFMDTQSVTVPHCMQTAKNELLKYMGTVIHAFQAYGAQESGATIQELLKQSDTHYKNFNAELEMVNKCAPFCIP